MKQTLLFCLFLVFNFFQLQAQDFSFNYVIDKSISFQVSDQSDQSVIIKGLVKNNSSETLDFTWIREEVYLSESWETAVCDKNRCYLTWVSDQNFSLDPGESGKLDAYLYPRKQSGDSAIVHIKLVTTTNPSDTVIIPFHFYQERSSSVGGETSKDQLVIYPNPASTYFRVSSDHVIGSIEIFDILGKELKAVYPRSTESYVDVIGLHKGIYIVRVKDVDGNLIKTQRLRKEMP